MFSHAFAAPAQSNWNLQQHSDLGDFACGRANKSKLRKDKDKDPSRKESKEKKKSAKEDEAMKWPMITRSNRTPQRMDGSIPKSENINKWVVLQF